jgi:hypothetical protein
MKLYLKALVYLFALTFFSCHHEPDIPCVDFEKQFSKNKESRFPLSDVLQINVKWNKVVFLPPYFSESFLNPLEISNSRQLESKIMYNSMNEGLTTVVFLDDNRAVAFSKVRRNLIDFAELLEYTPRIKLRTFTQKESSKITIIKQDEKEWAAYKIEKNAYYYLKPILLSK